MRGFVSIAHGKNATLSANVRESFDTQIHALTVLTLPDQGVSSRTTLPEHVIGFCYSYYYYAYDFYMFADR